MMSDHDSDSSANEHSVPEKRSNRSEIWEYFNKTDWKSKNRKLAKCMVKGCQHKSFSCGCVGTTRLLWHHLEIAHPSIYMLPKESQRKRLKESNEDKEGKRKRER